MVRVRAADRCEYCLLPQAHSRLRHHLEHIVARQHGGGAEPGNLALACHRCNLLKGPNLAGIDPLTGEIAPLFHPRRDVWLEHFRSDGFHIEGISAAGRATVQLLALNDVPRLELRKAIQAAAKSPPRS